jgi:HEAT repeat protein
MYVWSPLPRNLSATFRDIAHSKPRVRLSAVADLVRWAGTEERQRCIEQLIATLSQDEDIEVRAAAALALADTGAPEALGALIEMAREGAPRLRQLALVAIGELAPPGDSEALVQVRAALDSEAPALRFQALVAAGRLCSDPELESHLSSALADAEGRVRYVACRIIEERFLAAGRQKDLPLALLARLSQLVSDVEPDVAMVAAILLAPRGSQPARELLISALNQRRRFSHLDDEQAAIELCAELHLEAARPGLLARAFGGVLGGTSPLAFQARVALALLGDERARQHIVRGLSSWSRATRSEAVAAAGQARLEAARPRLLQMRGDERQADCGCVAEALLALERSA